MKARVFALAAALSLVSACQMSGPESQQAGGNAAGSATTGPIDFTTRSGVQMVYLPGGQFTMGSDHGNADEAPAHQVKLTPFAMDKFEVTHDMYVKVELPDPSHWQENGKMPVEQVRWRDAKQYCNERSRLEGLKPCYNEKTVDWDCDYSANGYRLPTEAEWEYACRAGSVDPGDSSDANKLRQRAWFRDDSDQKTHPVGLKRPNAFGIYDLEGNVAEWCGDAYSATYYKSSPIQDPTGPLNPAHGAKRVIRGGSWRSSADQCSPTFRQGEATGDADACFSTDFCGFRCVRRISLAEVEQLKKQAGAARH